MFEIALLFGVCGLMAKIASADDQSAVLWFLITFGICAASLLIPLPFIRMLIAAVVAFGVMIAYKAYATG